MVQVGSHLREKILIADDVRLHRTLAADILARRGYATVQADSGKRAIDLVNTESPDLVMVDALMPEVEGKDIVRRLKDDPDFPRPVKFKRLRMWAEDALDEYDRICAARGRGERDGAATNDR